MLDLVRRVLAHPRDYSSVMRRQAIVFAERRDEGGGVHSFFFTPTQPLQWKAGQHGLFVFKRGLVTGKRWRPFSVASSQHEHIIQIGTNVPEPHSSFKEQLLQLQPGDTMDMYGPFGEFHVSSAATQHIVGVAGGIGITPFRAILFEIANNYLPNTTLELIYAGKQNFFPFESECRQFAEHPQVSITWVNTPDEVNRALDQAISTNQAAARYHLSGSPGMIAALRTRIKAAGINRIVNDPFTV